MGAELRRRDAPAVEPFQGLDLTGLETCEVAECFFDGNSPEVAG